MITSKIINKNCEYDEDIYSALMHAQDGFINEIRNRNTNENTFFFQNEIDGIILKSHLNKDNEWLNKKRFNIKEQANSELKNVCVRVHRSISDIGSKKGYKANLVRLVALTIYYIVRLKPLRCFIISKINDGQFSYEYYDYNAKFALHYAKAILDDEYDIDLDLSYLNQNHFETLEYTLKYNTINKALIIEMLDQIVFQALEIKRLNTEIDKLKKNI